MLETLEELKFSKKKQQQQVTDLEQVARLKKMMARLTTTAKKGVMFSYSFIVVISCLI